MRKRLLAVAWYSPFSPVPNAAALMRRVRQVIAAFSDAGWDVDVVFRPSSEEAGRDEVTIAQRESGAGTVRYIGIAGPGAESRYLERVGAVRRAMTVWCTAIDGDRTARWARRAARALQQGTLIPVPSLAIGFFTPRGPLVVARWVHERWGVPWIADLQDPITEGVSGTLRPIVRHWMRQTLRSASYVVQVSPEWAADTALAVGRPVEVLRHAVPVLQWDRARRDGNVAAGRSPARRVLLYAGSIHPEHQNPALLVEGVRRVNADRLRPSGPRLVLRLACTRESYRYFMQYTEGRQEGLIEWLGWLDAERLREEMIGADALVVICWAGRDRQVVPSKLFDYLAYGKPVLLVGPDSGGVRALLREWGHPDVVADTTARLERSLQAVLGGGNEGLLTIDRCASRPVSEGELAIRYLEWAERLGVA